MNDDQEYQPKSFIEMFFYKMDRSLALLGVIVLGAWSLGLGNSDIALAAIGGLVGYIGGRVGR